MRAREGAPLPLRPLCRRPAEAAQAAGPSLNCPRPAPLAARLSLQPCSGRSGARTEGQLGGGGRWGGPKRAHPGARAGPVAAAPPPLQKAAG